VLGVIFLRHAANRFEAATRQIEADQASGRMPRPPLVKDDYVKRHALYLPEEARYDLIMASPNEEELDQALIDAMTAIEKTFESLKGVLPREFAIFERTVLEDLLRIFNREALRSAKAEAMLSSISGLTLRSLGWGVNALRHTLPHSRRVPERLVPKRTTGSACWPYGPWKT
jgi:hypothetical protein